MSVRGLHVYGMGNAIMDLQVEISDEKFASLELEKGSMNLVDMEQQARLFEGFQGEPVNTASGGSAANTIIALSQLGGKTAYGCIVGDDKFGKAYLSEMAEIGVKTHNEPIAGSTTGTSVILVTPDAERTMNTHLGVSSELGVEHINEELLANSEWLYVEGYLFSSPTAVEAVRKAVAVAKENDVKVAVTFSDAFIVSVFGDALRETVEQSDLVFANLVEATAFTGTDTAEAAFAALAEQVPMVALTMSEDGAVVGTKDKFATVTAPTIQEKDATGAGDMFAGGFLYGLTHGLSVEKSGSLACFLASKVVSQLGPRLSGNVRQLVEQEGLVS